MRLQRVVIGVDFGAQSIAAAKWAVHHFLRNGDAQLLLVYAVDLPRLDASPVTGGVPDSLVEAARTGALARLDELGRALGASAVRTEGASARRRRSSPRRRAASTRTSSSSASAARAPTARARTGSAGPPSG